MMHTGVCDSHSDFYDSQRGLCVIDAMQKGFHPSNIFNLIRFAKIYPDEQIVHALSGQFSWTHFREITNIKQGSKTGGEMSLSMKNIYLNLNSLLAEFSFMFLKKYNPQINTDEHRFIILESLFMGFLARLIDSNVITGILRRKAV